MPFVLDTRPDRRAFLTLTGSAFIGLATVDVRAAAQAAAGQGVPPRGSSQVRLALLSDTHIPADATDAYRGFRPVDNLRIVAEQVAQSEATGAIVAGDLARLVGSVGDYASLVELLRPVSDRMPVGLLLGNHDDRGNFRQAFPSSAGTAQAVANKHVMVVEQEELRFILLDSLLAPNITPGQLGNAQRTWLRDFLTTASAVPTAVFVHHTLDGADGALTDSDRLFDILRPHTQVKAVLYGHSHRYHVDSRDGIQQINLPAVGYNFADTEPVGWIDSIWTAGGVDLTLRAIGGNQAGHGQVRAVRWLR